MSLEALIERIAHGTDEKANPKLDLFEQEQITRQIVEHGLAALPLLFESLDKGGLPPNMTRQLVARVTLGVPDEQRTEARGKVSCFLTADCSLPARRVAIQVLGEKFSKFEDVAMAVLQVAEERNGNLALRQESLIGLAKMRLSIVAMTRLLGLLEDPEPSIVVLALNALAEQELPADLQSIYQQVLRLVTSPHAQVRHRAIDVLGRFGEIDTIEYVCMLPTTTPAEADAIRNMVHRILSKPRNVLRLSPLGFEQLMRQLLIKMGYEDVRDRGGPHDGGIDVEAFRPDPLSGTKDRRRRILVQCKRHRSPIGPEHVTEFIEKTLKPANVAQGLFVTTSSFSEAARQACSGSRIDLIDKIQLQEQLDEHFGKNLYCIRA
jgi:hypothetical protein